MQALVIVIFVREVSHITPLTNSILLISGMMNLTLTSIAGMVIDQKPTSVSPDPPSLALCSGWNLLGLFIQLNNNWDVIKKRKKSRHHLCLRHWECPVPVSHAEITCTATKYVHSLCLLSKTNYLQFGKLGAAGWCHLRSHGHGDTLKTGKCCWLCPGNLIFFFFFFWVIMCVTANCLG